MSRDIKYIGLDVHKDASVIAVLNSSGKLVMESIVETKATSSNSAVYLRSAGRVACDLGRRELACLALPSAATPGGASAGLRSAAQCLIKGRQPELPQPHRCCLSDLKLQNQSPERKHRPFAKSFVPIPTSLRSEKVLWVNFPKDKVLKSTLESGEDAASSIWTRLSSFSYVERRPRLRRKLRS
jgi:hypothetical protein